MYTSRYLGYVGYLNIVNGDIVVIATITYVSTNNNHLIGWEDCSKTVMSSSLHVADVIPGVGGWVVLVNSCCALAPFILSTNCH